MAIWVVEFSWGDTKFERFLPKNQYAQRKLLNFENWCNEEVSKSVKMTFKFIFLSQKPSEIFSVFFIEEYQFRRIFFVTDIFYNINF